MEARQGIFGGYQHVQNLAPSPAPTTHRGKGKGREKWSPLLLIPHQGLSTLCMLSHLLPTKRCGPFSKVDVWGKRGISKLAQPQKVSEDAVSWNLKAGALPMRGMRIPLHIHEWLDNGGSLRWQSLNWQFPNIPSFCLLLVIFLPEKACHFLPSFI